MDAWNGYHSVSNREEDRHLTTFYSPWGRYRYKTAPQGYNTSGDAYTHRYDMVVMGVENMRRVIDDTLLHADSIEKAFHQVAAYMTLVCWTLMRLMVMFPRERCSRMCKPDVRYWLASGQ